MAKRNRVVIGASAGGIEALQRILAGLPADLEAAVLIVLHTSSRAGTMLPAILNRAGPLPVHHPADGEGLRNGHIYIAPPDRHMLVEGDRVRIVHGPQENLHRPAIDPLFRSAAASCGRRLIGVVLSGMLDDGTAGLMIVRARGGVAVVQDPSSALFASMPESALDHVPDARCVPLNRIAAVLTELVREEIPDGPSSPVPGQVKEEIQLSELDMAEIERIEERTGVPSVFACPDCGGVLWETENRNFLRFQCRVGHAFSAQSLDEEQRQRIEGSLWAALRALEESVSLYQRMAERPGLSPETRKRFAQRAADTSANAYTVRNFLVKFNGHGASAWDQEPQAVKPVE